MTCDTSCRCVHLTCLHAACCLCIAWVFDDFAIRVQRPEPVRAANPMNPQVAPQPVAKTSIHTTAAREVPVNSKLKPDLHQMKPPKSAAHLYREQRLNKSSSAGEPPKMPNEGAGPGGPGIEPENPTARNIGILGVASVAVFSIWWYYSHKDPLEDFYRHEPVNLPEVEPLTAEDLQVNSPQAQQPLWLQRPRDSGSS